MKRTLTLCAVLALTSWSWPVAAQQSPTYKPPIAEASNEGELALKGFQLPEGMRGELYAAEPLLANPVAFCIDEKGRVFVAETFRQKQGVEDNRSHMNWLHDDLALETVEQRVEMFKKFLGDKVSDYTAHHDRIRLLIDSDGDGKADQSTVFSDGYNAIEDGTGAGVLARNGEVFYTCIPKLWKLTDKDNDGVADEKTGLHHGYGVRVAFRGHDMHGLVMGPDGRIYFSIGDRGYNVKTAEGKHLFRPDTGAVFRCEPDGSNLEVFAYGLRNPQELAFDDFGNLFTGDNNSDSGDQARWVYVVEGGDTGWRMYYQYLKDRGPWNREKLWHPYHKGQAAYIVPPVINIADGPSGLTYYPGVGLPDRYAGHFFLADFRGGPANSGIRSFAVEKSGATFKLVDAHQFIWKILGTDIDFGYDGGVYISDWVNGWDGLGKGRIFKFTHEVAASDPGVVGTAKLMADGFSQRSTAELLKLLEHPDRRVRQEAQFALADRNADEALLETAHESEHRFARIHAVWALGQIGRRDRRVLSDVVPLLADDDEEIRSQVARVLGDARFAPAATRLTERLEDDSLRVQSLAALALGRIGAKLSVPSLLKLLDRNANKDPVLRHAASFALASVSTDELLGLLKDAGPAARLGVVVALRRQQSPKVAEFLDDAEPSVILEAARAIHDEPIDAAMAQLAELADRPLPTGDESYVDALLRRVLSANFRIGDEKAAERVAALAASEKLSAALRLEALLELKSWDKPEPLDRVLGAWRPLDARNADFVAAVLRPRLGGVLTGNDEIRKASADLAAKYGIQEVEPVLRGVVADGKASPSARVAALAALDQLGSKQLGGILKAALKDEVAELRVEARRISVRLYPESAVETLAAAIDSGTQIEQQGAIRLLAELKSDAADKVLGEWLDKLVDGTASAAIQLDLVEAATARDVPELLARVESYRQGLSTDDPLAQYRLSLEGGDYARGYDIFFGRSSASCRRCHKVQGSGGEVGPDLSVIGKEKNREYLLEAIVAPSAKISKGFETVIAIMDSGKVYSGIVRSNEDDALKLMLADGSIVELRKDEIDETAKGQSAMPADLIKHLTAADLRDLVEYLSRQKTPAPKGEHR
ncbi:MAG: PVC-type heme-binding CxxCH protein [Planctomycetota bacterium]|jgi:quinoprotein glucose dehydrogenase